MTGLNRQVRGRAAVLQPLTVRGEDGWLAAGVVLDAREVGVDDFHQLFARAPLCGRHDLGVFRSRLLAQEVLLGRLRSSGGDAKTLGGHDSLDLGDLMVVDPEPGTDDHRIPVLEHPRVEADRAPVGIGDIQPIRPDAARVLPEAVRDGQRDAVLRVTYPLGERYLARVVRQQRGDELLGHCLQAGSVAIAATDVGWQRNPRLRCGRRRVRRQGPHQQSAGRRGEWKLRSDSHCRWPPKLIIRARGLSTTPGDCEQQPRSSAKDRSCGRLGPRGAAAAGAVGAI